MSEHEDPLVSCPFNKQHVFGRSRLQAHIIKCSRNYPNHVVCPYNALHRFLKEEDRAKHVLSCPDGVAHTAWKYDKPKQHGHIQDTPFTFPNTREFNFELENWDAEYQ